LGPGCGGGTAGCMVAKVLQDIETEGARDEAMCANLGVGSESGRHNCGGLAWFVDERGRLMCRMTR